MTGTSYDTRYTADATDDDEWTDWKDMSTSGMVVDDLDMGVEYTFELRALGMRPVPGLVTCTVRRQASRK